MEKYWKHLNVNYMTEESDDDNNPNVIIEHKLSWRSESKPASFFSFFLHKVELDDYIQVLDNRFDNRQSPAVGLVAKKERIIGKQSVSEAPPNAPSWATKSSGMIIYA